MAINNIDIAKLRNGEYVQFIVDVLAIVQANNPSLLMVEEQYNNLLALSNNMETLFKTPQGSIISDELIALDDRRDSALNGILALINGYVYSTEETIKSAAIRLSNHLSIFGSSIARDNYQSETATIRSILADWESRPELDIAISTLNLTLWQTELENANTLFAAQYLARAEENGTASPDNLKAKRAETNAAYYELRDNLNAHFTINKGIDPFGKTVSFINGLMDSYKSLLARRAVNAEATLTMPALAL